MNPVDTFLHLLLVRQSPRIPHNQSTSFRSNLQPKACRMNVDDFLPEWRESQAGKSSNRDFDKMMSAAEKQIEVEQWKKGRSWNFSSNRFEFLPVKRYCPVIGRDVPSTRWIKRSFETELNSFSPIDTLALTPFNQGWINIEKCPWFNLPGKTQIHFLRCGESWRGMIGRRFPTMSVSMIIWWWWMMVCDGEVCKGDWKKCRCGRSILLRRARAPKNSTSPDLP